MIRLDLPPKPVALSDDLIKELTTQFIVIGTPVWKRKIIEDAVNQIAFGKCCYSEVLLNEEGKYMEIDHFYPKSIFPEKVVEWGNLLPSNKKCNISKGNHNSLLEPIINPIFDNPKEHLYISAYRFFPKTSIGKRTIEVLALNDREHFVNPRSAIGEKINELLCDLHEDIENLANSLSPNNTVEIVARRFKKLLLQSTRQNEYSATLSTVILTNEFFKEIEKYLMNNNLWDSEFIELKRELEFCSLLK